MFWHYSKDDFMFTTVRVISKHQDTQVYGIILPQHLTNMLKFKAYMTYRTYATGEKILKPKSTKKKADLESSLKTKPTQASKGKRIKTSTKGYKAAKMKQSATKSKGDGVDIQSKVPDEQQHIVFGINEGAGDKPEVPNVPKYRSESEEESWIFSQEEDEEENDEHDNVNDNDDEDDDQENDIGETESDNDRDNFKVSTPPDYEMSDEEENQEDDDNVMGGEQEDKEDEELVSSLETKLSELKQTNQFAKVMGHDDQDKDEEPYDGLNQGTKRRRSGKEESSKEATQKESKSTSSSKGVSISQPKSLGKSAHAEKHGPRVDDL
ncbi:hypothetical protein Tco_1479026 [Tanacetum coccineum]